MTPKKRKRRRRRAAWYRSGGQVGDYLRGMLEYWRDEKAGPRRQQVLRDVVEHWHATKHVKVSLHRYAGMTWQEYTAWVRTGSGSGF